MRIIFYFREAVKNSLTKSFSPPPRFSSIYGLAAFPAYSPTASACLTLVQMADLVSYFANPCLGFVSSHWSCHVTNVKALIGSLICLLLPLQLWSFALICAISKDGVTLRKETLSLEISSLIFVFDDIS